MTTLIGIVAAKGEKAVILASDVQSTQESWDRQGDIAVRNQERKTSQKIFVDDKKELAVCMTGLRDTAYEAFVYELSKGEIKFREAVEKGTFVDLLNMNLSRFGGRIWDNSHTNSLLIATRYDGDPRLWTCWPLGKVEERYSTSLGSGSDYVIKHLQQKPLYAKGIDVPTAIDYVVGGLKQASADIYTGGLDIVVVSKEGIQEFGKSIENAVRSAEEKAIEDIKTKFKQN